MGGQATQLSPKSPLQMDLAIGHPADARRTPLLFITLVGCFFLSKETLGNLQPGILAEITCWPHEPFRPLDALYKNQSWFMLHILNSDAKKTWTYIAKERPGFAHCKWGTLVLMVRLLCKKNHQKPYRKGGGEWCLCNVIWWLRVASEKWWVQISHRPQIHNGLLGQTNPFSDVAICG